MSVSSSTAKLLLGGGAALLAVATGRWSLRRSRWFSFEGRTVIVTGGSRGLGIVLSRELVDAGARVAICARTEPDLRVAQEELRERGGDVLAVPCDVRDPDQVDRFVSEVQARWGDIDVLINNAGVVQAGPFESMTLEDFRRSLDTHLWGPLHTVRATLPGMRRRGWGRIVNIASLGGKQAVPHMLPYVASKFALVGLSNGLRTELARHGILVTTVCPSLMRTGSPRNALFKGRHRQEYAWFSIADSLPLLSLDDRKAARRILRACQRGRSEVVIAGPGNIAVFLRRAAPGLMMELMALADRLLPDMGGIGEREARGHESESWLSPSWLTQLGDRAAARNNEVR